MSILLNGTMMADERQRSKAKKKGGDTFHLIEDNAQGILDGLMLVVKKVAKHDGRLIPRKGLDAKVTFDLENPDDPLVTIQDHNSGSWIRYAVMPRPTETEEAEVTA